MNLTTFMIRLKSCKPKLTVQQYRTIKGQALAGDITGAAKGLEKLMKGGHAICR